MNTHKDIQASQELRHAVITSDIYRAQLARILTLETALRAITDFYANDCKCKLSDGFTCIVHRSRAALAKATT